MRKAWLGEGDGIGIEQLWRELGDRGAQPGGLTRRGLGISVEQQQASRAGVDVEFGSHIGQGPVSAQALVIQRSQHRVERVLDGAQVASGRARSDGAALDQHDPRASISHDRRSGAADDPASNDDNVCVAPCMMTVVTQLSHHESIANGYA